MPFSIKCPRKKKKYDFKNGVHPTPLPGHASLPLRKPARLPPPTPTNLPSRYPLMSPTAVLRFSDVLAAQTNDELPYSALKKLLRALRTHHPKYPTRTRTAEECTQVCTLSPTQLGRPSKNEKHEMTGTSAQRGGEQELCELSAERGDELLEGHHPVEQTSRLEPLEKSQSSSQRESNGRVRSTNNFYDIMQGAMSSDDWPDPSATVTDDLRDVAASQSLVPDVSQPSQDAFVERSPLIDRNYRDWENHHSPVVNYVSSHVLSISPKGSQSTVSLPIVSQSTSPPPSPKRRRKAQSPPPSHVTVGATINALLNSLVQHDYERGESIKWAHLRQELLDKQFTIFEPFCNSMDRIFDPLDPLATYKGDHVESSQSSAKLCVFYSNLFWQDAWKEYRRDSADRSSIRDDVLTDEDWRSAVQLR